MLRFVALAILFVTPFNFVVAQPSAPAELYPPSTLAYAELHDQANLAEVVAAIVKGTSLEDGLKLLHDRRDANKEPRLFNGQPSLSFLATLTSSEFLAEFRKLRGMAVGLTGFTKNYEPKIAAVVLTGESTAAALLAKTYLANEASFRRVDVLDGVPVFQSRAFPGVGFDPNTGKPSVPEPAKATEGPLEPTYAYTPGLFVIASNKEAVADILLRYRGQSRESLTTADSKKTFLDTRKAGINFYVRLADLVTVADSARKAKKVLFDPSLIAYLKFALRVQSTPLLLGRVSLRSAGLSLSVHLNRNRAVVSPLLDLLEGTPSTRTLQICPSNLAAALTVALPAREKRANAVLHLADAVAKAEGEVGKLPSDWLAEVERKSTLAIRDKYLASVQACSVLLPSKQDLPAKVEPLPIFALHLESEALANDWIEVMPKLVGIATGREQMPTPGTETIQGVRVYSIADGKRAFHFARVETTIVLGLDRKQVAACCGGTSQNNILTEFTTKMVILPDPSTAAYAAILPLGIAQSDQWGNGGILSGVGGREQRVLELPADGFSPQGPSQLQPLFTEKELAAAFARCPPIVGRVLKSRDGITAELRFDFGPAGAKPVIESLIPIVEKLGISGPNTNGRIYLDR